MQPEGSQSKVCEASDDRSILQQFDIAAADNEQELLTQGREPSTMEVNPGHDR